MAEQTFIVCTDSKEIQELERESSELRDLIPRGSMLIAERHVTDGFVLTHPTFTSGFHTHKDSRGRSVQPCISGGRFGVRGLTRLAMPEHSSYFTSRIVLTFKLLLRVLTTCYPQEHLAIARPITLDLSS